MKKFIAGLLIVLLSGGLQIGTVLADDVYNNLDTTIDASLETMNLATGGPVGTVQFKINQQNGDGKNGCNFTGNNNSLTVSVNVNNAIATVNPTSLTFGNCGDVRTVTVTGVAGGSTNVTLTQTSNTTGATFDLAPASFTVNVTSDTTAPVLSLPADITAEATGPSGAVVNYTATATDANPVHPVVTCDKVSGSTFALGTTTVSCSATDAAGNVGHGSFHVNVVDTTAPVISGTPSDVTMEAVGPGGAVVNYTAPTALDVVDGARPVVCSPVSGSTFALGDTMVACTSSDTHGNTATSHFHIIIQDTTAPVVVLPADMTTEATGPSGAVVNFTATANDLVDGSVAVACDHNSGDTFALGTTAVSCSATDAHGNTSSGSFNVTVKDTTPPVIGSHDNITVEATSAEGAVVTFDAPSANDLVDGAVAVECSPISGATFALGDTTVTCSATDAHGNTSSGSFNVTVKDTTPPVIGTNADIVAEATGPNGAVVTFSNPSATDAVDANPVVQCTPVSGSAFSLGHTKVTCSATDFSGNFATSFFDVFVQDTTPPVVTCGAADGLWHVADVSIACTASDSGSGLQNVSDVAFNLSTNVAAGTENNNVSTDTRLVCDNAGNCVTAGPIGSNEVDKLAPSISIVKPTASVYSIHQIIPANYSCADGGSGVAYCTGTVSNGSAINTSTIGNKSFSVSSADNVGNTSSSNVSYSVVGYTFGGFGAPITISEKDFKKTSTIPVKFQLKNADGSFATAAVATLKVNGVDAISSGNSNTGNLFRYDVSGQQYIFNLSTKPLHLGVNTLQVSLDDGTSYSITITIR